jgi:GNAT superfamily N-acetyltransferase
MRIVLASPSDLELYIDMLQRSAAWLNSRGFSRVSPSFYKDSMDVFDESIARGEVYFALIDAERVGTFRLLLQDRVIWPEAAEDSLYMHNLVVERSWSNQGIGRHLLLWAEKQVLQTGKTYLRGNCFADNVLLSRYYAAAGFQDRGTLDVQYPFGPVAMRRLEKQASPAIM